MPARAAQSADVVLQARGALSKVVKADPFHKTIRDDLHMNWICKLAKRPDVALCATLFVVQRPETVVDLQAKLM